MDFEQQNTSEKVLLIEQFDGSSKAQTLVLWQANCCL